MDIKQLRVSRYNAGLIRKAWQNEMIPRAALIGFGKVGRGVVAPALISSGFNLYAMDRKEPLVDSYKRQGAYGVKRIKHLSEQNSIVEGVWLTDNRGEFDTFTNLASDSTVKLIVTATLPVAIRSNITDGSKNTINVLYSILEARYQNDSSNRTSSPVNIICTEDIPQATSFARESILSAAERKDGEFALWLNNTVGFIDNVLDVITPRVSEAEMNQMWEHTGRRDELITIVEGSTSWFMEQTDFVGGPPNIGGITFVDNVAPYQRRQTHMFDAAQTAIAVLGQMLKHKMMNMAAQNEVVHSFTVGMLENEIIPALKVIKGFDQSSLEHFMNSTMHRISDPSLKDEISRTLTNPFRKLGRNERLVAPAVSAISEFGINPRRLCFAIASLLVYSGNHNLAKDAERLQNPDQAYWAQITEKQQEIKAAIQDILESRIPSAMVKLDSLLQDDLICGLDMSLYPERLIARQVKDHFIAIVESDDISNTLMELLRKERKPIIIRPTGFVSKG
ncbi:MAG: hypothetical protein ABIG39_06160 [Candidatus Micrarchaeota archaeon]